jgi:hypothetical protein
MTSERPQVLFSFFLLATSVLLPCLILQIAMQVVHQISRNLNYRNVRAVDSRNARPGRAEQKGSLGLGLCDATLPRMG